jgi:hypothetical protein
LLINAAVLVSYIPSIAGGCQFSAYANNNFPAHALLGIALLLQHSQRYFSSYPQTSTSVLNFAGSGIAQAQLPMAVPVFIDAVLCLLSFGHIITIWDMAGSTSG